MAPGTELGVSDWHRISQEDINAFAKLTRDEDPYHTEPDWAREHSPLGTTISFGFLTLSMLTCFLHQVFDRNDIQAGDDTQMFNFGFNRVRLPEPVPAGAEIRGRFAFGGSKIRQSGSIEFTFDVTVEIKEKAGPRWSQSGSASRSRTAADRRVGDAPATSPTTRSKMKPIG